jgi:DNA-binding transcriptional ArsR family regulator
MKVLDVIQAIGEPTRFEILRLLRQGEMAAGEIADRFAVTRPAVSQHLGVLRRAGLVHERRAGTYRYYSVRSEGFDILRDFLDDFWTVRLRRLKQAAQRLAREKS